MARPIRRTPPSSRELRLMQWLNLMSLFAAYRTVAQASRLMDCDERTMYRYIRSMERLGFVFHTRTDKGLGKQYRIRYVPDRLMAKLHSLSMQLRTFPRIREEDIHLIKEN